MFELVHCNASILARQTTDPNLFFVRTLVKNWLWPIITCFGVTGNILAIIVLTKRRMIMSSTNNYLASLALVDIAYLILTLILNTSQHPCFTSTSISAILLTIFRPIADFSSNTSVWLTVTFTVERWVAISYPLQSRTWCTVSRARRIIISVMCAALICTLPSAFEMKLVRIIEIKNSTEPNEKPLVISRIRAKPTTLGNSLLYHQIYFNFVTFAIIWIPLLLLVIFNTILIIYVHRSVQSEQKNKQGIQLRRHTQGNQGEQRKTTIMLIAVVIVFTVCQIPQAISLTVQSFFPVLSQTPKVLIYNNFANCLVALNASINFVLYCCFSERFRSTFSSNFAFLTKYCTPYMASHWKFKIDHSRHSTSTDNMSYNYLYSTSNYLLPGRNSNARLSNVSSDADRKYAYKSSTNCSHQQFLSLKQKSWSSSLSKFNVDKKGNANLKKTLTKPSNEMYLSLSPTSVTRTSSFIRQSPRSIARDHPCRYYIEKIIPSRSSTSSFTNIKIPSKHYSLSMCSLPRPILMECSNEKANKRFSITSSGLTERPTFDSHQSLDYHKTEDIWIKRHLSNSTLEKNVDQRNPLLWKEVLDVTV
ncbi:unnamed protein product [Rotaria socialis]|uniref:G-protein coupled receptors family 1 profile domain-containing protein n=1 Tax=Rotaria socialis TaxID=392032 RepID=A0A821LEF5_9BILA|nr:unnamed protein product [Rotaria socialis]CAF3319967.1 unnamed protein product [Rotaria socialis]CAF3368655.1 unnamed protein product [Rotaria socialis]CAF3469357.1 unnamed protein product [Rotaria socialis]CAF3511159.1 unnamed protein product [Rotaria socialis]